VTARERLEDWVARVDALDVGDQRGPMGPGGLVIGGVCWKCMSTEATTELGVCASCLSWLRCEDLGAASADTTPTTTSSSTEDSPLGLVGPAVTTPPAGRGEARD
jgi:hypothetical protein